MTDDDPTRSRREQDPPTGRYHARWHRALRFVAQRLVLRPVVSAFTRTTVEGVDNVQGLSAPFVLVANHCSHLDTAVAISRLPYRLTRHLAVGAAADYFYGRWWIKAATSLFFNTYPVPRAGRASRGRGMSQRLLKAGVPILLYPEGTRSRDGKMREFKPGAAVLSATVRVPCVPMALIGTHEAMPVGRFWPAWGRPRVRVLLGQPMHRQPGERLTDYNQRIMQRIRTMLTMRTPYVVGDSPTRRGPHEGNPFAQAS